MIVCHCNQITDQDIANAIDWMRAADGVTVITPGKVWRALGKRPDCAGCLPLFLDTMAASDSFGVPRLRPLHKTRPALRKGTSS